MSSWYDRFTKAWASTGIVQDPSDAQANAGFAFLGQAPPTVELFNSMFQWNDKKDTYLYNQMASVFTWGGQTASETNPNTLRDAIIGKSRIVLTADTNYYVDPAGSNSNNGAIGTPWQTIQYAYDYIVNKIDPAGFLITINLKTSGSIYAAASFTRPIGKGFAIRGDPLNPKNYIIRNATGPALALSQGVVVTLQGVAVEAAGAGTPGVAGGIGLLVQRAAVCYLDEVAFGLCSLSHMQASEGGVIWPAKVAARTWIYGNSTSDSHAKSICGSIMFIGGMTTTIQNSAAMINFFNVGALGLINIQGWTFTGTPGTVIKYGIELNGVLYGAGAAIPGTGGTATTGGQYLA